MRLLLLTLVAVGATAFGILGYGASLLQSLEGSTINTRFTVRGTQAVPKNLIVVAIDPKSFQDLNKQFPFPRAVDGKAITTISKQHPAAIAVDVQLSEPSSLGQNDDVALLEAVSNAHGKTIFSDTEPTDTGNVSFLGSGKGTALLKSVGARPAEGSFPFDPGGTIRQMQYRISNLNTLAVVAAQVATHKPVKPFSGNRFIDFVGPAGTIPYLSFSQAYWGTYSGTKTGKKLPSNFFTNKIVVIGATATNLNDIHASSTDSAMPGPEIQANAIDTVLRGFPLSGAQGWINVLLIVLLGVTVPLVAMRARPVITMAVAVILGVALAVGAQLAFNSGTIISFVYPLGALILATAGALSVQLVTEAFERIRTRDLFTRFVPENVVDEVLASSDGLRLGGVQRDGTVMFSDLRGFTSMAETLSPARVIEVLNHYLSEMSDAILNNGGTLVAYMGDGIMAVFGAPLPQEDHADRALAAALEMRDVRLPRFNEWLRSESLSEGFRMGIGLNSGHVMSGHVGSERRVEYTAVGDTTNTASRIEGMTKGTPHQLLLSGFTKEALHEVPDDIIDFGEASIRGRVEKMSLWSLPEPGAEGGSGESAGDAKPDATAPAAGDG
ncbi:MAG TPA: adenylate/guanylate cyclase domain-containing protein, partial [Solirubrobacteraceae bacterium]